MAPRAVNLKTPDGCLHLEEPNNFTVANGSADPGRKRFSVNFVF